VTYTVKQLETLVASNLALAEGGDYISGDSVLDVTAEV
jgi:hypothetical protein